MGGQQFLDGGVLLDARGLNRILELDAERGLVRVEAGILWDDLIRGLREMQQGVSRRWSVVQKQTGADRLSIGGALAANGHGRGLTYKPIVQDVESLDMVGADGVHAPGAAAQRTPSYSVSLSEDTGCSALYTRLRCVSCPLTGCAVWSKSRASSALNLCSEQRIADGFTYGDFQYRTDETSPGFLRDGVMSCYIPVPGDEPLTNEASLNLLSEQDWRGLLYLSHADKARAFDEYARFYMSTNGQTYDSDTFQLSMYIDDYHRELDRSLNSTVKYTETITELYVPLPSLADFMDAAARELRERKANVIYGTIRLIEQDDETFLNWARQPYACIVFNLHVEHTESGIAHTADALRALIDLASERNGQLLPHIQQVRHAGAACAVLSAVRRFRSLRQRQLRPGWRVFSSDWLRAYGGG